MNYRFTCNFSVLLSTVFFLIACSWSEIIDTDYFIREIKSVETLKGPIKDLDVYCYPGGSRPLYALWKSVYVELKVVPKDYSLLLAENHSEVVRLYQEQQGSWLPLLPWQQTFISLPAFDSYCFGIATKYGYELQVFIRNVNYWRVLQLIGGLFVFLSAPSFSRNVFFFYATGVSFGVIASLLIIVFVLSRLVPKKAGAYTVMLFGWSLVLYSLQLVWNNIRDITQKYHVVLLGYITVASLISFAVCYRYGPVTDYRSLNLIQWTLQLISLVSIFYSSELREVSTAIIIVILIVYNIPKSWIAKAKTLWLRKFPPKVKLLTEAEYIQQASEETRKALEALRTYCESPNCSPWKLTCRLKDPVRFARFIEGESHLSDQEILEYDSDSLYAGLTGMLTGRRRQR
ncbi:nuclear envelope integral membrane protein-like [Tachypleus tridentatus]|uniref:nuclear envelope integral membrane protein-like n=1 Tax=Tachypleus tridentatus TaxID=6853 RepID=UPI003FD416A1